jgi:RNA polymerase sigma-70 factor (ECF subfamily)
MNALSEFSSAFEIEKTVLSSMAWNDLQLELNTLADEDLMDLVVDDNSDAFSILMERHLSRITAMASKVVYAGGDAEDAAQEVFINIWKRKHTWQTWRSSFSTWLYRITIHKCIDLNKKVRHSNLDDAQEPVSQALDALSQLHLMQFSKHLSQAIGKLSEGQQMAVALHYSEGLSAQDCAAVMGMKKTAVEALLKRARQKLRDMLEVAEVLGDKIDAPNQICLAV